VRDHARNGARHLLPALRGSPAAQLRPQDVCDAIAVDKYERKNSSIDLIHPAERPWDRMLSGFHAGAALPFQMHLKYFAGLHVLVKLLPLNPTAGFFGQRCYFRALELGLQDAPVVLRQRLGKSRSMAASKTRLNPIPES